MIKQEPGHENRNMEEARGPPVVATVAIDDEAVMDNFLPSICIPKLR